MAKHIRKLICLWRVLNQAQVRALVKEPASFLAFFEISIKAHVIFNQLDMATYCLE